MNGGAILSTEESVAKLSARLLEGWTMLSETCPLPECSVPLMRSRSNREISCVQCNKRFTEDYKPLDFDSRFDGEETEEKGDTTQTLNQSASEDMQHFSFAQSSPSQSGVRDDKHFGEGSAVTGFGATPVSPRPPQKEAKEDSCKGLADKLLQGWTLTDQYCPKTLTPLVRNKEKKLFCVTCDKFLIPESELHTLDRGEAGQTSGSSQQRECSGQHKERNSPQVKPSVHIPNILQPNTTRTSNKEICTRAINVLFSKMDVCVTQMEGIQQVPGEEASKMLDFLNNASKAILAVNDVKDTVL